MLPSPAPLMDDELLFSGLSRLARRNALLDTRQAMKQLTGGQNYCVSADYPCHLTAIVARVGLSLGVTNVEELIERHTLFPYYRLFVTKARWSKVREIALSDDANRLKAAMGILAHGTRASPVLRYCPECIKQSCQLLEPAFWRRAHHLPGVTACAKHGHMLILTMSQSQFGHRARLCCAPAVALAEPTPASEAEICLARVSMEALLYRGDPIPKAEMRAAYVREIIQRGWTRPSGRHDVPRFEDALRLFFTRGLDPHIASRFALDRTGPMSWVRDVLRPRGESVAPIGHIMIISTLFGTMDRFIAACGTSSAGYPRTTPQEDPEAPSHFAAALEVIADASLSCRQVAAAHGVSVGWVVKQRRRECIPIHERPKSLDKARTGNVMALLAKGSTVAEVACKTDLSASTVYRILSSSPSLQESRRAAELEHDRQTYRAHWLTLRAQEPAAGTKALRHRSPGCYSWLYRNDRQWMLDHQPTRKRASPVSRIDWDARDVELARRVLSLVPDSEAMQQRMRSPRGTADLVFPASATQKHASQLRRFLEAVRLKSVQIRGK